METLAENFYIDKNDTNAGVSGISPGAGFMYRKKLGKGGARVPSGN